MTHEEHVEILIRGSKQHWQLASELGSSANHLECDALPGETDRMKAAREQAAALARRLSEAYEEVARATNIGAMELELARRCGKEVRHG